jgi:hypothetical protein
MAILVIKEMEAQAIERGQSFQGPLSTYAFPVKLADVRLHPRTGQPVDWSGAEAAQERVLSGSFTSSSGSGGMAGMNRRRAKVGCALCCPCCCAVGVQAGGCGRKPTCGCAGGPGVKLRGQVGGISLDLCMVRSACH